MFTDECLCDSVWKYQPQIKMLKKSQKPRMAANQHSSADLQ